MAPAGTPEPVLKTLEAGIVEAMRDPGLRAAISAQGWEVVGSSAAEFGKFLDQEVPRLGAAAKAAGVKAD
jgi:tripartite-type tricarboxylate transporter receptor subunit TctC